MERVFLDPEVLDQDPPPGIVGPPGPPAPPPPPHTSFEPPRPPPPLPEGGLPCPPGPPPQLLLGFHKSLPFNYPDTRRELHGHGLEKLLRSGMSISTCDSSILHGKQCITITYFAGIIAHQRLL